MRIVSLNVNGFRGIAQMGNYVSDEDLTRNLLNLKKFIGRMITNEYSIVILQEIPHEAVDTTTKPWIWEKEKYYYIFKQLFENDYKVFWPKHMIHSKQCTVAVCAKKTKWDYIKEEKMIYDRKYSYGNKVIELEVESNSLLGLHVNPCDEMWEMIFTSLDYNEYTYIVGDFNAYEKRGTMKGKPNLLRSRGYSSVIPSNVITDFEDESAVDNLYINLKHKLQNGISVGVQRADDFITDHAACMFEV